VLSTCCTHAYTTRLAVSHLESKGLTGVGPTNQLVRPKGIHHSRLPTLSDRDGVIQDVQVWLGKQGDR